MRRGWNKFRLTSDGASWILIHPNFLMAADKQAIRELKAHAHAQPVTIVTAAGERVESTAPRLVAHFGTRAHLYGGVSHPPDPVPLPLSVIQTRLWAALPPDVDSGLRARSCDLFVLNVYRDGNDCIHPHSDTPQSGVFCDANGCSLIGSVSVGAPAKMVFRDKTTSKTRTFVLEDGCALVMGGTTQQTHTHEVPRDPLRKNVRMNVTWRAVA